MAGHYEAVTAYPEGTSTVSRYAKTAASQGYDGLVVRTRGAEYDAAAIGDRYDVDIVAGIEVDAESPDSVSGSIGNFRGECTLLSVRGGTNAVNRYAVEQDRIDVLTGPMAGNGDFNHVLARAAETHGVRVEFDFGPVLRSSGGQRVQALRGLRKLRELVEQYDTPYVVSANATSHFGLRAPRELIALGEQIGFSAEQVETGLAEWGRLAARNRERTDESFIAPGVKRGKHEEDG
ncbi:RNase P subunit p30 family protein [Halohasta litorea]|uniref:Ribonuclease P protein component 3 n=1 Tax=Halohasta litorea TaxID=869891 RepID=A0ABD6D7N0_9EURY|nr:RNase P subunit p30 family protein [Halohasta litorea]